MKLKTHLLAACASINCLVPFGIGNAATINTPDCSQSAIQAAVDFANSGDTVTACGVCTWSAPVRVSRAIVLEGAGISSTIINSAMNSPYGTGLIEYPPTATAILDRLLHHAMTLNIRGNSYRLKEKLNAGLVRTEEVEA